MAGVRRRERDGASCRYWRFDHTSDPGVADHTVLGRRPLPRRRSPRHMPWGAPRLLSVLESVTLQLDYTFSTSRNVSYTRGDEA